MERPSYDTARFSFELKKPHNLSRIQKLGVGLGAAAFSVTATTTSALDLDTKLAYAFDRLDPPTTSVYDPKIVSAKNPEQEARIAAVDPELIKKCRESDFIVIHLSGLSMETSHYAASVLRQFVESYNGCSMYHWYGHKYDAQLSARSVVGAIEGVTSPNQPKTIVFIGSSLGGIASVDIVSDNAFLSSPNIKDTKIIMVGSPNGIEDVKGTVLGLPPELFAGVPIPKLGYLPIFVESLVGRVSMGNLDNVQEWIYSLENAAKTRPPLTHSELQRIQRGMGKINPGTKVSYFGSTNGDARVDVLRAVETLRQQTDVQFTDIQGVKHDSIWLAQYLSEYIEAFTPLFDELFGKRHEA